MTKHYPKVSVIMPVYNGSNYVNQSIDSVLEQKYPNFEVIAIDDGSTDNTYQILCSYGSKLYAIKKNNGGCSSALNLAIQYAKGKYIAWLSHDDLFLPGKIQRQAEFLENNPQCAACYTDYYIIDANGNIVKSVETPWYSQDLAIKKLFGFNYINGSTMMIKKNCFEDIGVFSENLKYTNDLDLWFRILHKYEIGRISEKLGKLRVHAKQVGNNMVAANKELQLMYVNVLDDLIDSNYFNKQRVLVDKNCMQAKAYTWFGDIMAEVRGWYKFAEKQYIKSLNLYCSVKNPALYKIIINRARIISINVTVFIKNLLRPIYNNLKQNKS